METNDTHNEEKRMSFTKRSLLFVAIIVAGLIFETVSSIGSIFYASDKEESHLGVLLDSLLVETKKEFLLDEILKKDTAAVELPDTLNLDKTQEYD